jgi:hypothetical protein
MRKLVALFALAFFFAPLLLWVGGVRARPFENRPMASAPTLSQGWDAFDGATRFFVDRLPLREQAVRANTWVSESVFSTTPDYGTANAEGGNTTRDALPFGEPDQTDQEAPEREAGQGGPLQPQNSTVLKGRDDWLFLEADLAAACAPSQPWAATVDRMRRMVDLIRASGRKAVFVIPADKSTIYPEFLPDGGFAQEDCYEAGRQKAWAALEGAGDELVPLRKPLLAGKEAPPEETYHRGDTHWNTKGAIQGGNAVLKALGAPLIEDADIVKRRQDYPGDLTGLVGAPEKANTPWWTIKRPGQAPQTHTEERFGKAIVRVAHNDPDGPPLLPGRTIMLYDSFGVALIDAMAAYTRDFGALLWYGDAAPAQLIEAIVSADVVVLEKIERDIGFLMSDGGIVTEAFLRDLETALK